MHNKTQQGSSDNKVYCCSLFLGKIVQVTRIIKQASVWYCWINDWVTAYVNIIIMSVCSPLYPPFFPVLLRPVMVVRRCSRRQRGSITADLVARVSAIPAPVVGCRCQRGAGVMAPSGCVRPATASVDQLTLTVRVRHVQKQDFKQAIFSKIPLKNWWNLNWLKKEKHKVIISLNSSCVFVVLMQPQVLAVLYTCNHEHTIEHEFCNFTKGCECQCSHLKEYN